MTVATMMASNGCCLITLDKRDGRIPENVKISNVTLVTCEELAAGYDPKVYWVGLGFDLQHPACANTQ